MSSAWGKPIRVKPIKVESRVAVKIEPAYFDGEQQPVTIKLVAYERYVCGEKVFEFKRAKDRGGERIVREWLATKGVESEEFPLSFCELMKSEPRVGVDSCARRAVRNKKLFNGKTVEEWYVALVGAKGFDTYLEAELARLEAE